VSRARPQSAEHAQGLVVGEVQEDETRAVQRGLRPGERGVVQSLHLSGGETERGAEGVPPGRLPIDNHDVATHLLHPLSAIAPVPWC
jgi:hypothetical protein